jgi:hypothetical protein
VAKTTFSILLFPRFFSCGLSKTYAGATAVLVDELDTCEFQSLAQRGFVCERNWKFTLNDFDPANRCYADLRGIGEIKSTPSKQRSSSPHLSAGNFLGHGG